MAKKKIEEMNKQELAAEKAANKVEVVSKASEATTEHPMIRPEVKETIDVAPMAGGTINASGDVVSAPLKKDVQTKLDTRSEMQKRREENSKRWVDTIEAKEKELGRALTSQEIVDIGDAKGLWAYQALHNKGANWGNLAGGAFVGSMNNNTYNMLRSELDSRAKKNAAKEKGNNHWNKEIAIVPVGDNLVRVNKGMQTDMTTWGSQITDPNYVTPEQATMLYDKLQSYGIDVPKKTVTVMNDAGKPTSVQVYDIDDNGTSLAQLVGDLDNDAKEVMQVLGFYDDDWNLKVPKKETFEEMMARREKAEEAMRLQSQQRELERQKARLGLADLAAGIGDIIKASGGALVDKRSYQDMYDRLTAQQQKNFDNYLARMEALKAQEKAKQKEAADRAYQERLIKEQRLYNEQQQERQWLHDADVLEQKHQNKLGEIRERAKHKLVEIGERNKNQIKKFNNAGSVVFNGIDYTFDKAHNNNAISALLPIVRKYFTEENGYLDMLAGIEDSIMSEYGKAYETGNIVVAALGDFEYQFSEDDRNNIVRVLSDYASSKKTLGKGSGNIAGSGNQNGEAEALASENQDNTGGMY